MGKTRYLFKKIRDPKGTFNAKMGSIKDRNGMDLTEERILRKGERIHRRTVKKDLHNPDNHEGVITHSHLSEWCVHFSWTSWNVKSGGP